MNLSLIVSCGNLEEIALCAKKMIENQKEVHNGALSITFDDTIKQEVLEEALKPLSKKFKTTMLISVPVNKQAKEEIQKALLFGTFLIQGYGRFPGSWLIIDEKCYPSVDNFMDAAERQHNSYAAKLTGRFDITKGSALPIGPIVIDLPKNALKFLRYPVATSWRERARFFFSRCRLKNLSTSEYIFNLGDKEIKKTEKIADVPIPDAAALGHEIDFNSLPREEVIAYIVRKTGKAPHHKLQQTKLVNLAEEIYNSQV
jgi:hypothetical protein